MGVTISDVVPKGYCNNHRPGCIYMNLYIYTSCYYSSSGLIEFQIRCCSCAQTYNARDDVIIQSAKNFFSTNPLDRFLFHFCGCYSHSADDARVFPLYIQRRQFILPTANKISWTKPSAFQKHSRCNQVHCC